MPAPEKIEDKKDREVFDRQETVTRCSTCPGEPVIHAGTAAECRAAFLQHRHEMHPEIADPKKSKFGSKRACNVGDCMNPAAVRNGRYAGMCAKHRDAAKAAAAADEARQRGAIAGGKTRSRQMAERRSRPKRTRITPPRLDAAYRIYQAGCTIRQIAAIAYQEWGYTNETACSHAIGIAFKEAGHTIRGDRGTLRQIPDISRSEAISLVQEAR
jgi:hypothetical protein